MRRLETRLRGEHAVVDLPPPARYARLDPPSLELVGVERRRKRCIENLARAGEVGRDAVAAEDERRGVLFRLDLATRPQPHPREQCAHRLAELGLRQQQKVLVTPTPHDERRNHPGLCGQQERRARVADL